MNIETKDLYYRRVAKLFVLAALICIVCAIGGALIRYTENRLNKQRIDNHSEITKQTLDTI